VGKPHPIPTQKRDVRGTIEMVIKKLDLEGFARNQIKKKGDLQTRERKKKASGGMLPRKTKGRLTRRKAGRSSKKKKKR